MRCTLYEPGSCLTTPGTQRSKGISPDGVDALPVIVLLRTYAGLARLPLVHALMAPLVGWGLRRVWWQSPCRPGVYAVERHAGSGGGDVAGRGGDGAQARVLP